MIVATTMIIATTTTIVAKKLYSQATVEVWGGANEGDGDQSGRGDSGGGGDSNGKEEAIVIVAWVMILEEKELVVVLRWR